MTHCQIEISRDYRYCFSCEKGFFPLDHYLGIEGINYSEDFALTVGHFTAITGSFEDCQKAFKYAHLSDPSVTFIQKVANKLGGIGIQEEDELVEKEFAFATELSNKVVPAEVFSVLMDGGRCMVLPENKKLPEWKEVKVGGYCTYQREKDLEGILQPIKKHCNYIGRVEETSSVFGNRLWLEATRRGYHKAKVKVFLGDGAPCNWEIHANYFSDAIGILDFYHGKEHLAKAIRLAAGEGTEEFKNLFEELMEPFCQGDWQTLKAQIEAEASKVEDTKIRKEILGEANYFYNNRNRINYAYYKSLGLPIGSGVIEAGIKQTVNKRIKGTEKHWRKKRADNILKLRLEEISGTMQNLCQLVKLAA